jgi:hypothetical protein
MPFIIVSTHVEPIYCVLNYWNAFYFYVLFILSIADNYLLKSISYTFSTTKDKAVRKYKSLLEKYIFIYKDQLYITIKLYIYYKNKIRLGRQNPLNPKYIDYVVWHLSNYKLLHTANST